ncbi:MAG: AAA family ATPase [Deltaproteobacteria bacterium]|nr:AAA family ATPase [Deltaproteobacteria bacterium]
MSIEIERALLDPNAYPHGPETVEMAETHISWVFLAGDFVYKVKKPVDFGFLDFTDLAKRRRFCEEEVRLNRRLAPDLYLGVVGITRENGELRVEGTGDPIEYAVKMKRMPRERMMDRLLEQGKVDETTIRRICELLVDFYDMADTGGEIDRYGKIESIRFNTDENFMQTEEYVGVALSERRFDTIRAFANRFYEDTELFESRIRKNRIRDCHGDLHSGNICIPGEVIIYDCIEFNERFRYSDVTADIAFLSMDLDFRGRRDLSELFVHEFALKSGDLESLLLMDFYKCYRAYVRGKILCFAFDQAESGIERQARALETAKKYFALAESYTGEAPPPRVIVMFGLIATGKTTLAEALGARLGAPVISSDPVRKNLVGLAPSSRQFEAFGQGIYDRETTDALYRKMVQDAEKLLAQGQTVILDASFRDPAHRSLVMESAKRLGAETTFVLCECEEELIRRRLSERLSDPHAASDGRWEIYQQQKARFEQPSDILPGNLIRVDSGEDIQATVALLERLSS